MQLKHNASCQNCDQKTRIGCFCFCEVDSANCKSKASQLTKHYICRFLGAKKRHATHPYRKIRIGNIPCRKPSETEKYETEKQLRKIRNGKTETGIPYRKCCIGKSVSDNSVSEKSGSGNSVSESPYQIIPYRTNSVSENYASENPYQIIPYRTNQYRKILYRKIRIR